MGCLFRSRAATARQAISRRLSGVRAIARARPPNEAISRIVNAAEAPNRTLFMNKNATILQARYQHDDRLSSKAWRARRRRRDRPRSSIGLLRHFPLIGG